MVRTHDRLVHGARTGKMTSHTQIKRRTSSHQLMSTIQINFRSQWTTLRDSKKICTSGVRFATESDIYRSSAVGSKSEECASARSWETNMTPGTCAAP
eukprot:IDg21917t1